MKPSISPLSTSIRAITVHKPVIDLNSRAVVAVVGIVIGAAGPIGRQIVRRMAQAVHIHILQAGLLAVWRWAANPGNDRSAVLHHDDYDVFDLRSGRPQHVGAEGGAGGQSTGGFQEGSAIHSLAPLGSYVGHQYTTRI